MFGRKIQHSSPVERKSFAAVIFAREREREMSVLEGYECFRATRRCFFCDGERSRPMMREVRGRSGGEEREREGRKGDRERRCLIFNSKQV